MSDVDHTNDCAAEQEKPSEGFGNDTSPGAAREPQGRLSGREGYDNDTPGEGSPDAVTNLDQSARPIVVVAFDPGITTGVATGIIKNGHMEVGSAQYKWHLSELWLELCVMEPHHIVYERFDFRRKHRDGLELFSRELIGVIKLYHEIHGNVRDIRAYAQTAAEGKAYFTDKELKDKGVYKSGNPHAMDAVRHLLHWYTFKAGYRFNTHGYSSA